jgi:hypothetical protein
MLNVSCTRIVQLFLFKGPLCAYQVQQVQAVHVMSHLFVSFNTFCFVSITVSLYSLQRCTHVTDYIRAENAIVLKPRFLEIYINFNINP